MNIKFSMEQNKGEVLSSKAGLVVNKLTKWIEKNNIDLDKINTENAIKEILAEKHLLIPGVTADEVIVELKKSGFIRPPTIEKVVKPVPEIEHFKTEFKKLEGIKKVEDENVLKQLEENKLFQELEKDIFKNENDLNLVYDQALSLGKENPSESIEEEKYYYEFAEAGLIKGGAEEVKRDLDSLKERKELFKKKTESLEADKGKKVEKSKKIATIVERAIAYSVSNLGWYGDNVSIEPTSQFDDIKRGVDEVLEIRKDDDESSFMGLGIDVTYRGLLSEQYKEKFFILLQSIQDGFDTKIKYNKKHNGDMMKEFSVPKTILFFNANDVKDISYMVKNVKDPKVLEEFKNSPKKIAVMNQLIIGCELFSNFAEESKNSIFKKYTEIVSSIKELAWKNPEIKKILDARHEDEVSIHMKYLVNEFKDIKKQKKIHS